MVSRNSAFPDCPNCSATVSGESERCSVCGFDLVHETGGIVRFEDSARQASDGLGGLLEILPAGGREVKFIGRCVGGLFALDRTGHLVWRQDWGYITGVDLERDHVVVNGIRLDVDSGDRQTPAETN